MSHAIEQLSYRLRHGSPQLTTVNLPAQLKRAEMARLLPLLQQHSHAHRLRVVGANYSQGVFEQIVSLIAGNQYREIQWFSVELMPYQIDQLIEALPAASDLQELTLVDIGLTNRHLSDFSHLAKDLPNLTELNFAHNQLTSHASKALEQSIVNSGLTTLNLSHNALGDRGVMDCLDGLWHQELVQSLNLANCRISDHGAKRLMQLATRVALKKIDLANNFISDKGAVALANHLNQSVCQNLNLSQNRITEQGGQRLVQACEQNYHLHTLNLSGNALSAAQLTRLHEVCQRNQGYQRQLADIIQLNRQPHTTIGQHQKMNFKCRNLPEALIAPELKRAITLKLGQDYAHQHDLWGLLACYQANPTEELLGEVVSHLLRVADNSYAQTALFCLDLTRKVSNWRSAQAPVALAFYAYQHQQLLDDRQHTIQDLTSFKVAIPYQHLFLCLRQLQQEPVIARYQWLINQMNPQQLSQFITQQPLLSNLLRERFTSANIVLIEHLMLYPAYFPKRRLAVLPVKTLDISLGREVSGLAQLSQPVIAYFQQHVTQRVLQLQRIESAMINALRQRDQLLARRRNQLNNLCWQEGSYQARALNFLEWAYGAYQDHEDSAQDCLLLRSLSQALDIDFEDGDERLIQEAIQSLAAYQLRKPLSLD